MRRIRGFVLFTALHRKAELFSSQNLLKIEQAWSNTAGAPGAAAQRFFFPSKGLDPVRSERRIGTPGKSKLSRKPFTR